MKRAKFLAWIAFLAMTAALLNGFINGDFFEDGSELMQNPWGIVSLVDLYAGFTLFAIWIAYRENSLLSKIVWIVALMVFGFFVGSLYVLYALHTSDDDLKKVLMGQKASALSESI
ncbi:MAG: DUF1475 family protein [Bacillota bacterium]